MTEEKKVRMIQDIHQEYSGLAMRAGHLEYGIVTNRKDLDIIYSQMRDLNLEAAALQAKNAEDGKSEVKNG